MRLVLFLLCSATTLLASPPASYQDQRIAQARQQVAADPKGFQTYNDLATALCRKARDMSELSLYKEAESAVKRSLAISPGNYDGLKLQIVVLLGEHEFAPALKLAQSLNKRTPDDVANWAFLVDVHSALGNYAEAEKDCQWILDLRRASALGFEKAAGLREVFGDNEGASEFYNEALTRTAQSDIDQRAWLLTQKARLQLAAGNAQSADDTLAEVRRLFPTSQLAALVMADVQTAKGNRAEAARIFEECYKTVPSTANLYKWANALDPTEAAGKFEDFEKQARGEISQPYNANLELIDFYTAHKIDPREALRIATLEAAQRQDCATLAALAWAEYQNGQFSEAKIHMDKALAVGIQDIRYTQRASLISAKLGESTK